MARGLCGIGVEVVEGRVHAGVQVLLVLWRKYRWASSRERVFQSDGHGAADGLDRAGSSGVLVGRLVTTSGEPMLLIPVIAARWLPHPHRCPQWISMWRTAVCDHQAGFRPAASIAHWYATLPGATVHRPALSLLDWYEPVRELCCAGRG